MTMQNAEPEPGSSPMNAGESMSDKVTALRITMLAVSMQLMFRAMLLLRRWNY